MEKVAEDYLLKVLRKRAGLEAQLPYSTEFIYVVLGETKMEPGGQIDCR